MAGLIAGVDEVGRGAWAGPLVVGAVILDPTQPIEGLADSKSLTPARRTTLARVIRKRAISYAYGIVLIDEFNEIGLARALHVARARAIAQLKPRPKEIICDGLGSHAIGHIATRYIIAADATIPQVSAAATIAKVYRDNLMRALGNQYPAFGFDQHKGYGTPQHRRAIERHGICMMHRIHFAPIKNRLLNKSNRAVMLKYENIGCGGLTDQDAAIS
ncbi:ribonuclease HII [Candidatus Berkelbacteria bacterium]|nr:ribonuclease HII [Candidatus Berkelbacteria bacterium]